MKIGSVSWRNIILAGAEALALEVSARQMDLLARYAGELIQWNRKINLTAITDAHALAVKHFLDSMAPVGLIPAGVSLLDIGSGAGFPGIPLKIIRSDVKVTLIDAVRKKVNFQKHVIRTLGLEDIRSFQTRAEQFACEKPFDVIITRALSSLKEFVLLALPLLAENGVMLAWKGNSVATQSEISILRSGEHANRPSGGPLIVTLWPYRLPGLAAERTIVAVTCPRV